MPCDRSTGPVVLDSALPMPPAWSADGVNRLRDEPRVCRPLGLVKPAVLRFVTRELPRLPRATIHVVEKPTPIGRNRRRFGPPRRARRPRARRVTRGSRAPLRKRTLAAGGGRRLAAPAASPRADRTPP